MLCVIAGRALVSWMTAFPSPVRSTTIELTVTSAFAAVIASRREHVALPPALLTGQFAAMPAMSSVAVPTVKVSVAAAALVAGNRHSGASHTRLATRKVRRRAGEKARREATTDDIHSTSQKSVHALRRGRARAFSGAVTAVLVRRKNLRIGKSNCGTSPSGTKTTEKRSMSQLDARGGS